MNEIEFTSIIKKENLDNCNYFKSLIEEGLKNQLIMDENLNDIQMQLLQLLDEIVYKYNGIDSSSIRTEIMEDINNSNSYIIGVFLKTFRNPDEALKFIMTNGVKKAYEEGRKKIEKMLKIIRLMYIKVKQNMLEIPNYTYNDTINGGIQGFLKIYDPDFKAQDMKITADYPLYNNLIGKLEGVEFVKEYVYSIYLENVFCNKFSVEKIKYLLYGYAETYKDLIINIFEILLIEAVGCQLVKRNIQDLAISNAELNEIYLMFKNKEQEEIRKVIIQAYQEIREEILIEEQEVVEYIEKNFDSVVKIIINGIKNNSLDKVFITQKFV